MPIQIGGIVSGLDTDFVIEQLLEIENIGKTRLETQKTENQEIKDIFGTFNTQLLAFKTQADALLNSANFQARTASSSDTEILTSTASTGAVAGKYDILIDRLATASSRQSGDGMGAAEDINTNVSRRSTTQVTPGTSALDLTATFANAGFTSAIDTSTTVTITTDAGMYTSGMLSSYASVQDFIDEANADMAGINIWYDSDNDRFNVERKNNPAGTLTLTESAANGFFSSSFITTGMAAANETGLNLDSTLVNLNTDTAVGSGAGSFKINDVQITYNTATDTLENLIGRINLKSADTGVTAFYDQSLDQLILTRTTEGPQSILVDTTSDTQSVMSRFKIDNAQALATNGAQALFSINGNQISSDKNTYAFNGITLNLKQQGNADGTVTAADASATITVSQDATTVADNIESFVNAYNDIIDFLEENASYNVVAEDAGKLFGDSLVTQIETRLSTLLFAQQSDLDDSYELMAQIGIELGDFDTEDEKKLVVDRSRLEEAIVANPQAVEKIFAHKNSGSFLVDDGIAKNISDYIKELTKFQGLVDIREDFYNNLILDIDDQLVSEEDRIERVELNLRRQFTAMEQALSKINAQSGSVLAQLQKL